MNKRFTIFDLARNDGKRGALMDGYSNVHRVFIVILADDCQCPVSELWGSMGAVVVSVLLGFVYGLYVVIHKLAHPEVPVGYSSIMAVILFASGMIMLLLGIIGEYLGRIYISLNKSPQYVIRETINLDDDQ